MGHVVEIIKESSCRNMTVNKVSFWDHRGNGLFTSLYWYRSYVITDFPLLWKSKRFSWDNSYDEWMDVFKKLGYKITITEQPSQKEFSGRTILSAKFKALSSDGALSFDLNFNYGDNGYYTFSPKTLYMIAVRYEE